MLLLALLVLGAGTTAIVLDGYRLGYLSGLNAAFAVGGAAFVLALIAMGKKGFE